MNLNEMKKDIHENAVKHGWWDSDRSDVEIIALVHSEWSEALEAYRDGEPMVHIVGGKPEGIAVELIDGVIRLLDAAEAKGLELLDSDPQETVQRDDEIERWIGGYSLPELVCDLHCVTCELYVCDVAELMVNQITTIIYMVYRWLILQDYSPNGVLMLKHRYNLTRPYRHGGKKI